MLRKLRHDYLILQKWSAKRSSFDVIALSHVLACEQDYGERQQCRAHGEKSRGVRIARQNV